MKVTFRYRNRQETFSEAFVDATSYALAIFFKKEADSLKASMKMYDDYSGGAKPSALGRLHNPSLLSDLAE